MTIPMQMDWTEPFRLWWLGQLNPGSDRDELVRRYGQTWDATELATEFKVMGFMAPFVVVRRKVDGVIGSLEFQHNPRLYFNWQVDR